MYVECSVRKPPKAAPWNRVRAAAIPGWANHRVRVLLPNGSMVDFVGRLADLQDTVDAMSSALAQLVAHVTAHGAAEEIAIPQTGEEAE